MARELRAVGSIVKGREFQTTEELNAFLQESVRGKALKWKPETAPEHAQELVYQALESPNRKERVRLALQALGIFPDCADAYNLLADDAAKSLEQAKSFYQKGVEAGVRALGLKPFAGDVGHFWGILETRPYMRAREGLADCLRALGQREEAVRHYQDMLRLNPNDNQGVREKLLACLLEAGDVDAAEKLLEQYNEDYSAVWHYTRALVKFIRQGTAPDARQSLREALKYNRYVVPYLTGSRRLPRELPDYIGMGDRNEAVAYVAEFGPLWRKTPAAVDWVVATFGSLS